MAKFTLSFCVLLFASVLHAQKVDQLDFEDDVIGGRGDVFVNSFVGAGRGQGLEAILYLRKDFNEFYQSEFQKRRVRRGRIREHKKLRFIGSE